jgi:hypothetical protein
MTVLGATLLLWECPSSGWNNFVPRHSVYITPESAVCFEALGKSLKLSDLQFLYLKETMWEEYETINSSTLCIFHISINRS